MDRYLSIQLDSAGLSIETAQADFYITWLGLVIATALVGAIKIRKVIKSKQTKRLKTGEK